ncbi:hypothetical protein LMG23992_04697 [Cupriavidus laharis]|uniref:LysR substrate-binding domain-containing protein n=2 Tax=Cupriavidus laharis TaxID=151654 RepID=A0ABN7ZBA7_9BURK|nr:hypothetical protein LMG23992_04697 [Cupriavidus laharis]
MEGRRARLTENGAALLARANELLGDAYRLEQLADNLQRGWEAEVRLAVDAALPADLLLSALKAFAGLAPQTRVHLTEVVLSGADQALLQRQADLAVGTRIPTGHFGECLLDIPFVAAAHPAHPLHQLGRELAAEDLSREMQVVLRDSGQANPRDDGWLGATLRWTVSHMQAMRTLVAGGVLHFRALQTLLIAKLRRVATARMAGVGLAAREWDLWHDRSSFRSGCPYDRMTLGAGMYVSLVFAIATTAPSASRHSATSHTIA